MLKSHERSPTRLTQHIDEQPRLLSQVTLNSHGQSPVQHNHHHPVQHRQEPIENGRTELIIVDRYIHAHRERQNEIHNTTHIECKCLFR
jgi:hypothetical protein